MALPWQIAKGFTRGRGWSCYLMFRLFAMYDLLIHSGMEIGPFANFE